MDWDRGIAIQDSASLRLIEIDLKIEIQSRSIVEEFLSSIPAFCLTGQIFRQIYAVFWNGLSSDVREAKSFYSKYFNIATSTDSDHL